MSIVSERKSVEPRMFVYLEAVGIEIKLCYRGRSFREFAQGSGENTPLISRPQECFGSSILEASLIRPHSHPVTVNLSVLLEAFPFIFWV